MNEALWLWLAGTVAVCVPLGLHLYDRLRFGRSFWPWE